MTSWDNIVSQIEEISNYTVRYKGRHSLDLSAKHLLCTKSGAETSF